MIAYPPVRPKEEIKAEFDETVAAYRAKLPERDYALADKARKLAQEHQTEVLEDFSSETRAVRLSKMGDKYHVSVYEYFPPTETSRGASISGSLFFGGTEDEAAARAAYEEEVNDIKTT
jgi:hypothetical protein